MIIIISVVFYDNEASAEHFQTLPSALIKQKSYWQFY